jgi:uncharacterized protein YjiS (DUF1127 family)
MIERTTASHFKMESIMIRTANFATCDAPVRAASFSAAAVLRRLGVWFKVADERRKLAAMSSARLADMGLDCDKAWSEASRPFWDAPLRTRCLH